MIKPHNIIINNQRQGIDFKVMGLDEYASNFLNWCLKNRNNLEYLKDKSVFDLCSAQVIIYFDSEKNIGRVDKTIIEKR